MDSLQQALASARQQQQAGRHQEAEVLCRQLLQSYPNCAEAWGLLADLCLQAGNTADAMECAQRRLRINRRNPAAHSQLGIIHMEQGQFGEAAASLQEALRLRTNFPEAHNNLGIVLMEQGQREEAVTSFRKALELRSNYPEARNNLGVALLEQDKLPESEEQFRRVLRAQPEYAEAYNNLGNVLSAQRKVSEAQEAYEKALRLKPDYVKAHVNLAALMQSVGRHEQAVAAYQQAQRFDPDSADIANDLGISLLELGQATAAVDCFRQALQRRPNYAEAHNNLGIMCMNQGHTAEAIALFQRALRLQADYPEACNNLGNALAQQGEMDEAAAAYLEALRLRPTYAEAHHNLGLCRAGQGKVDEAIACYEEAVRLEPAYVGAWNNLGNAYKDQARMDESTEAYRQAIAHDPEDSSLYSNLLFGMHYDPRYDAASIFAEHLAWARLAQPLAASIQPHLNDPTPGRRLRLGYVSPDLRIHVVGFFAEAIIAALDRDKFEVYCYAEVAHPDPVAERIRASADAWRVTVGASDEEVAGWIREDKIDILVDLAGHTAGNRLLVLARRPAPVQVTHHGYPDTTGLATVDYRITDAVADPPGLTEAYHTEELVRLPEVTWCYTTPLAGSAEVEPPPSRHTGQVTFASFNNPTKITVEMLELWARVLAAVPGSRLHVLTGTGRRTDEGILATLKGKGIDPERITLLARADRREDFFARFRSVDVCLDTHPYAGCTTTGDCLWMGVPVVTLAGKTCTSRQSAPLLAHLGLQDLIAQTSDDYVASAVRLATDLPRLAKIRHELRERMRQSTLTNVPRFTRQLEEAYRRMWHRWCAGAVATDEGQSWRPTQNNCAATQASAEDTDPTCVVLQP